jgi:ornithine decarboxylase
MTRAMSERIARFLADQTPETPCLVVDLDLIADAYEALQYYLPLARIYYAVKANPAAEIVRVLNDKGASFDVASPGEIALCLGDGVAPDRLSFGNTIKKEKDIADAYEAGVRLFARQRVRARKTRARGARRQSLLPDPGRL